MIHSPGKEVSVEENRRSGSMAGIVLIVIGLVLFTLQFTEGLGGATTLAVLGALFVAGYLYWRAYGLLIPGGILLGLGLGSLAENSLTGLGDLSSLGLGLGFVSIYVIAWAYQGGTHWWPLIPGAILIVSGLAQASAAVQRLVSVGWPLILVLVGLFLVAGGRAWRGRSSPAADQPEPTANLEEESTQSPGARPQP